MLDQRVAPIYDALQKFNQKRVVPFDVPGHKRGRDNLELTQLLAQQVMNLDVNSMEPLDNHNHPSSVIKEAESLAAEAFGAKHAFSWSMERPALFKPWFLRPSREGIRLFCLETCITQF